MVTLLTEFEKDFYPSLNFNLPQLDSPLVSTASVVEEIAPRQKQFTTPMERAVNNSINRRQAPSSAPSQAENKEETTHKRRNFLSKFFSSRWNFCFVLFFCGCCTSIWLRLRFIFHEARFLIEFYNPNLKFIQRGKKGTEKEAWFCRKNLPTTCSSPNMLPQALEMAAIFAMMGRLWMTKETSFFWIRAKFCAWPKSPYLDLKANFQTFH